MSGSPTDRVLSFCSEPVFVVESSIIISPVLRDFGSRGCVGIRIRRLLKIRNHLVKIQLVNGQRGDDVVEVVVTGWALIAQNEDWQSLEGMI